MVQRYVDFSLGIESAVDGGYVVRGFSPDAEAESVTDLPFDSNGLAGILGTLAQDAPAAPPNPQTPSDFEELGRTLFGVLFPGQVGELYVSEWNAAMRAGKGIRIRLHLRPNNPHLAWLSSVPWELIFDERVGGFPCLNPLNPLIRHLDLPRPVERIPFRPPIHVLVAAANPSSDLDLDEERKQIEESGRIKVKVLERADPEDLRKELRCGKYQIIHFMGHGLIDDGDGSLVFSAPGGRPKTVTGKEMSQLVQGVPTARLVVLNACRSAASPQGQGVGPLSGVAGALVRGGQPAVVGMQFAIFDSAAIAFSKVLYEKLGQGDPIEAAVAEARLAVYFTDRSSTDWFAPVLFLRGADSRLEASEVEKSQGERDEYRVDYEADVLKARRAIFTASKGRSEGRARDSIVNVKTGTTEADEIIITASDNGD